NSLISPGVTIEEGAVVKDSIVFTDVKILKKVKVNKTIVGENVIIGEGAVIGTATKKPVQPNGITIIENNVAISPKSRIVAGSEITI
ncbi:MAG: glucose-1-phosphate adenylyltransferase, partial [Peptostreptococcaceae bacterium]|nr:glucose-1-phosphate adenylyltransferase [Peptostreptococcaceae bacterium]